MSWPSEPDRAGRATGDGRAPGRHLVRPRTTRSGSPGEIADGRCVEAGHAAREGEGGCCGLRGGPVCAHLRAGGGAVVASVAGCRLRGDGCRWWRSAARHRRWNLPRGMAGHPGAGRRRAGDCSSAASVETGAPYAGSRSPHDEVAGFRHTAWAQVRARSAPRARGTHATSPGTVHAPRSEREGAARPQFCHVRGPQRPKGASRPQVWHVGRGGPQRAGVGQSQPERLNRR